MPVTFYATDTYAGVKQKFTAAWPNLTLEVHHSGHVLWKEGSNEISDTTLMGNGTATGLVGTFTDDTIADTAIQFFAQQFSGEVFILRQGVSVEKDEPLAYCNQPFMLPLEGLMYGQYQRLFKEHWTNLSIKLYDATNDCTELAAGVRLRYTEGINTTLHDHVFISDWLTALARKGLYATISNDRLGLTFETGMTQLRLKELQQLEKSTGTPMVDIEGLHNFDSRVRHLFEQEGKMSSIKFCTDTKGWGLAEAKEYVEELMRG